MPFGPYLLLKRVAVGGMAELYLARDTRNERLVVLKRILPYLAEEAEFLGMFLDEARVAAALHHPNIVELYELGHIEKSTFIAMEWVDGIDLRRVLQKEQERGKAIPYGIAAWIVSRLCLGLGHAHQVKDAAGKHLGIIHRDVSPQNVMVSFTGDVKLVDFGIAKVTAWMSRSKPGIIKGKFLYLAPEQLTAEPLDARMDLFALGTLLYELTTGQSPFYRSSTEAVIYAIRMEEPEAPGRIKKDYPPALAKIVLRCLVKDRTKRYQTALDVERDLEAFVTAEGTTRTEVETYIAQRFGNSQERTRLYIPPNAQVAGDVTGNERPVLEVERPSSNDRREAVLPPRPIPQVPEGARATIDLSGSQSNPWQTEPTAMMPPIVSKPDASTIESKPSLKSLSEPGVASQTDPPEAPKPPIRAQVRPGPPVPTSDSIPEISASSIISALNERGGTVERVLAMIDEPLVDVPDDDAPLVPSTRALPRRNAAPPVAKPLAPRRPPPVTQDLPAHDTTEQRPDTAVDASPRRGRMLALVALAGLLVGLGLATAYLLTRRPTPAPKPVVVEPEPVAPAERIAVVRVQVRAPKGTVVSLDGRTVQVEEVVERKPGPMQLEYACPPRKRRPSVTVSRTENVPDTTEYRIDLLCP